MHFAIQFPSNVDSLRVKASPKEFHLSLSPAVIPCLPGTDTISPAPARPPPPATARHLDLPHHALLYILSR